ncbi:hypothetical protein BHE74_00031795, partial [Ensete ventricosum]
DHSMGHRFDNWASSWRLLCSACRKISRDIFPRFLIWKVLTIPVLAAYPFMSKLSGLQLTLIVNCASLLKNVLSVSIV